MGVNIDEARHDQLAAGIDHFGGAVGGDIGADRGDAAGGDGHVADRIDPQRGIDDAAALDEEIIGRCRCLRRAAEDSRACDGCLDEPAPGQHDITLPWWNGIMFREMRASSTCELLAKHKGRYWAGDVAMSTNTRGGQRDE